MPEQEAGVIRVLLDLTGEEVALLEEDRLCPRCTESNGAQQQRWRYIRMHWGWHRRGEHPQHSA